MSFSENSRFFGKIKSRFWVYKSVFQTFTAKSYFKFSLDMLVCYAWFLFEPQTNIFITVQQKIRSTGNNQTSFDLVYIHLFLLAREPKDT